MNKVINDLKNEMNDLSNGMETNHLLWTGQVVTQIAVKACVADLQDKEDAVVTANNVLIQAKAYAKESVAKNRLIAGQVISLAEGIHALDTSKLTDYNLTIPHPKKPVAAPGKAVIESLKDEDDGIGFKIKFHSLADVQGFEIERSTPQSSDLLVLAPPYLHLKNSLKLSYVDDDIIKGKRYFYRGRGYNHKGFGEWSDISSKVQ